MKSEAELITDIVNGDAVYADLYLKVLKDVEDSIIFMISNEASGAHSTTFFMDFNPSFPVVVLRNVVNALRGCEYKTNLVFADDKTSIKIALGGNNDGKS